MEFLSQHFDYNTELACLPPGFRFHPTDEELIKYYLLNKVLDRSFTGLAFTDVDLNKCEPWELPGKAKMGGGKEWYFFSLRDRKYPTGLRTNRATEAGYWKATGKDHEIYVSKASALVGMKKTLVFYHGRAPKGEKTNWVMHEYRLEGKFAYHLISKSSKDEWVISRVFKKSVGSDGAAKKRFAGGISLVQEDQGSCSSAVTGSLPPLPDSSTTNQKTFPYNINNVVSNQHVPCFSTTNQTLLFNFPSPKPLASSSHSVAGGVETTNHVTSTLPLGPTELDCIWSF